jgi:hypothetical protein
MELESQLETAEKNLEAESNVVETNYREIIANKEWQE